MLRAVLSIIAGYAAMAVIIIPAFIVIPLILGTDGMFKPGSYEVNGTLMTCSIAVSIVGALAGGVVCGLISRASWAPLGLAAAILALGFVSAAMHVSRPDPGPRKAGATMKDILENGRQPAWYFWFAPLIGAAGAIAGARCVRRRSTAPIS